MTDLFEVQDPLMSLNILIKLSRVKESIINIEEGLIYV